MKKSIISIFVLIIMLTNIPVLFADNDSAVIAIVYLFKNEPITYGQLRTEVEKLEKSTGRKLNDNEQIQVLDTLINERLALQAAEHDKIIISDDEINQSINQFKAQMAQKIGRQPTDAEFVQDIKNQTNMEFPEFRESLRRHLIIQKYLISKKGAILNDVKAPTDNDILSFYNSNKAQFVRPETVRFSMIQVPYGENTATKARAKELADRLMSEIGSSADKFDEVVRRGQVANSGFQAGDGGYLPRTQEAIAAVGRTFADTAFALKVREISKLIEGINGYQIIKITEKYADKTLELSDIAQLGNTITVRDYIKNSLFQERQQEAINRATKELLAELRTGKPFTNSAFINTPPKSAYPQKTIYVSAKGSRENSGRSEAEPATFYEALSMAMGGLVNKIIIIGSLDINSLSIVNVFPAVFQIDRSQKTAEEIIITGKPGASATERAVLSAKGSGKPAVYVNGYNIRFEHIEISNGEGKEGFGLIIQNAQVTLGPGSTVRNNAVGGIAVDTGGTCIIDGGEIHNNNSTGIIVGVGGVLILRNGTIRDNNSLEGGGGVIVRGEFTMSGGTITGNRTATLRSAAIGHVGGGVGIEKGGRFTMTGGSITNNWADGAGGGVFVRSGGRFDQNGGTVSGNTARLMYPDVYRE